MSIYVITGGTTGIGAEARKKLQDEGHEVFNIDYNGGDYTADLSTDEGRKGAVKAVFLKYPDGIDGVLCNAGVGPTAPPKKIFALNFFAAIAIAEGLRPLLKKKGRKLCRHFLQLDYKCHCKTRLGRYAVECGG